jgi:hypothetical protein
MNNPFNRWPIIRDIILFFGGVAGVAHETLAAAPERPTLLILFAAMMGLPAFLRQDDKGDKGGE